MLFDRDKYNENIDYCEYVFRKIVELDLNFTQNDIQLIANRYVFELIDGVGDLPSDVVEDDILLYKVIDKYIYDWKHADTDIKKADIDFENEVRLKEERLIHSLGGHGLIDSYEDLSYEDIQYRLKRK